MVGTGDYEKGRFWIEGCAKAPRVKRSLVPIQVASLRAQRAPAPSLPPLASLRLNREPYAASLCLVVA